MARPVDPDAQYRIKPHVTKGYMYASTQPSYIDALTGKKKYHYIHWGTLDSGHKFYPGTAFYMALPEERERLIFPENWDISEAKKLAGLRAPGRPAYTGEAQNRLYGDIWLLEQVAIKTGIRQDLEKVFGGNLEIVDDIMTLAMFPYLTKFTYNRVARWQRVAKSPSSRELIPTEITRLTQSITEQHRMDLLSHRAARLGKDELCAVDTTSRSAYGDTLTDIRWGKNKDGLALAQTIEAVVYTLTSHMPVYYKTFPGNMPDSRGIDEILADLEHAGFKNLVLVTDRGYETIRNLEKYILRGQSIVMCTKASQKDVAEAIHKLGEYGARPEGMTIDPEAKIYYSQYDIDYKRDFNYYKITYNPATRVIESFTLNEKKIAKARVFSGFFSIITHGVDYDPMKAFHTYGLRDEQEKCFQQMKDQMVCDRQRNWSEEGKTGRLFILFVTLIMSSYVRHVWKSTRLHDLFSSSLDLLDEMRSIRLIEHSNRAKIITPFIGAQVDICAVFGFDIPKGCAPTYASR